MFQLFKKAGRDHGQANCSRRQCTKSESGKQCCTRPSQHTLEQSSFNGRDITVNIVKVRGDAEEIQTKIYEVVVSGMNDSKKYMIN